MAQRWHMLPSLVSFPFINQWEMAASPSEKLEPMDMVQPNSPTVHSVWNLETVYIQVNETLFIFPKRILEARSDDSPFQAIFSAPPIDKENVEGSSKNNPIILENIAEADFDNFLRVLYPLPNVSPPTSFEDWLGVLQLSHMWHYDTVRAKAIQELNPILSASRKISLGGQYLVQAWVRQGFKDLVRDASLNPKCLSKRPYELSWETIAKVFHAKYLCTQQMPHTMCECEAPQTPVSRPFAFGAAYSEQKKYNALCECRLLKVVDDVFKEEVIDAKFRI